MPRLLIVSTLIVGIGVALVTHGDPVVPRASANTVSEQELASLSTATAWLNTPPLTAAALRGKVVLVQVWTFSCINWLRTMPYVRAWHEKYQREGLVVIGVHAPEFAFERNIDDVRRATSDLQVSYPVAIDNNYSIWRAFKNNFWPALFLLDTEGRLRHQHFGEGDYERTERFIQQLLAEGGSPVARRDLVSVIGQGVEAPADWHNLRSPETYVGYERTDNLASPEGIRQDARQRYSIPGPLPLNRWALGGDWTVGRQATVLHQAGGRIAYRFHARDLHLVMGPATEGKTVHFRVLIDGLPPGAARGGDVDELGYGIARELRLYQLIRQPGRIEDRLFTIEFFDADVAAYAFTFG
jgi:thiol-disulfide isomerase/thioredoxin